MIDFFGFVFDFSSGYDALYANYDSARLSTKPTYTITGGYSSTTVKNDIEV